MAKKTYNIIIILERIEKSCILLLEVANRINTFGILSEILGLFAVLFILDAGR